MKTKIYYKRHKDENGNYLVEKPFISDCGDYIDLRSAETIAFNAPQSDTLKAETKNGVTVKHRDVHFNEIYYLSLGISIKVPEGFYCEMLSRSSTPKKAGIMQANAVAIIDGPNPIGYCGNNDIWRFPVLAIKDTLIEKNQRIAQFSIKLSQKATMWQKLKWLFSDGIELIEVDDLDSKDRNGLGSTGKF